MNAFSPWLLNTNAALNQTDQPAVYETQNGKYRYKIIHVADALWLVVTWPKGSRIAFRLAYSPNDVLNILSVTEMDAGILIQIGSVMGEQEVKVSFPLLHWTTTLTPAAPLLFPYWPRDIVPLGAGTSDILAEGEVKASQVGTRSGQLYFNLTRPKAGSVFYFHNLTALAEYNQATETSAGNTVGGEWPEIGFALPPTLKQKPLEAGKPYVISDAYVALSEQVPADEPEMVKQYLDMLAAIYLELPKPATTYKDWPEILKKGLRDLEQEQPLVMDSWYLQHPLLNLSRMAMKGDELAKKIFFDSLEFAIKVAKHFDYSWPVFYKMDTLEVVKAETQPGKGGQKDVPGLYAHVMLQAWELTGDKRYLAEAEKAALRLKDLGFDLFYQANNTAFSAGAMLRLYKITKNQVYLDLSYLCLANVFKNVQLWDCNYGYGKNLPTFFALFPLSDAPYTAAYEEQEVFCALHDYLHHAEEVDIAPSVRLLIAEFIRFVVERCVYYYPPMLPKEMLSDKVKTGEVDPNLWIALEDLHDGWEKSGEVGQEVYGAGNAFGILPRHYMQVDKAGFMIYTDYPTYGFTAKKHKPTTFRLCGDGRLSARLMIVKTGTDKLPELTVTENGKKINGQAVAGGNLEFEVRGDSEIKVNWK